MALYDFGKNVHMKFCQCDETMSHYIYRFDCGDDDFNELVRKDWESQETVKYLFIDIELNTMIAYLSLACSGIMSVIDSDTERSWYENELSVISAVEIKYFAVNSDYRHLKFKEDSGRYDTLSARIFEYCLKKIECITSTVVGAETMVLYAVPKAKTFYKQNGFKEFESWMTASAIYALKNCISMYRPIVRDGRNRLVS